MREIRQEFGDFLGLAVKTLTPNVTNFDPVMTELGSSERRSEGARGAGV